MNREKRSGAPTCCADPRDEAIRPGGFFVFQARRSGRFCTGINFPSPVQNTVACEPLALATVDRAWGAFSLSAAASAVPLAWLQNSHNRQPASHPKHARSVIGQQFNNSK